MTYEAKRNLERSPSHPGELVHDIILDLPHSKKELAEMLQISRQQLYDIVNCTKPVSPQIAAKLGKLFGGGAGVWLRMQAAHDAWHAERTVDTSQIPTLETA